MKLLIMVLSSRNGTYLNNLNGQKQTWDSEQVDGCKTVYYTGLLPGEKFKKPTLKNSVLNLPVSDDYKMMHWKFKRALDYVWNWEWDFIFRTNSSTYVRKQVVYDKIKELPSQKVYAGLNGGGFISGTGIILSRDCAQIVKDSFNNNPVDSEDCAIGSALLKYGIEPQEYLTRLNYNFAEERILEADYYRCKSEIPNDTERKGDLIAFNTLFKHYESPAIYSLSTI